MKKICKILNKRYYEPLAKRKANKTFVKEMESKLQSYGLKKEIQDDLVYVQQQILYRGICNKEVLEEMFLDAYVNMYDYWYDLDYQQRKHQVNVDLQPYKDAMITFKHGEQTIYLPMFDERMNRIYENEMVLFALKQYQKLKHEFHDYIVSSNYYGKEVYASDFCDVQLLVENEHDWVLYDEQYHVLYLLQQDHIQTILAMQPKEEVNQDVLLELVRCVKEEDTYGLLKILVEKQLCDAALMKKWIKRMAKLDAKAEKLKKKANKKRKCTS